MVEWLRDDKFPHSSSMLGRTRYWFSKDGDIVAIEGEFQRLWKTVQKTRHLTMFIIIHRMRFLKTIHGLYVVMLPEWWKLRKLLRNRLR